MSSTTASDLDGDRDIPKPAPAPAPGSEDDLSFLTVSRPQAVRSSSNPDRPVQTALGRHHQKGQSQHQPIPRSTSHHPSPQGCASWAGGAISAPGTARPTCGISTAEAEAPSAPVTDEGLARLGGVSTMYRPGQNQIRLASTDSSWLRSGGRHTERRSTASFLSHACS